MKNLLTIIVQVQAKQGFEDVLVEEQTKLVAIARKSPGCIRYELHRSNSESGLVYFVEEWESRELWQIHMNSDYIRAFQQSASGFIETAQLHEMHHVA